MEMALAVNTSWTHDSFSGIVAGLWHLSVGCLAVRDAVLHPYWHTICIICDRTPSVLSLDDQLQCV